MATAAAQLAEDGTPAARPHQQHALDSLSGHKRSVLVMACGTGKTLVGRWHAEQTGAEITVVLVPSLSLVAQTLQEWRAAGPWPFEALITCSDPATAAGEQERIANDGHDIDAPFWANLRARVTTNPAVVAQRLANRTPARPTVIFSTYHSLPVVADAVHRAGVEIDLVVADEAHNLAGRPRQDFRIIFDNNSLPVAQRVFMTATPVAAPRYPATPGFDDWTAPISMDDETLFGPVVYRLGFDEAIQRELLADYEVMVYETTGEQLTPDPVAALASASTAGLKSVLSFHGRVAKARAFAAAIDGMLLSDGRRVRAMAVAGSDPTRVREQALALLREPSPNTLTVVSSARCLAAGVDIPAVDGILFADPKYSDVDVIQSVGRALRRAPGKTHGRVMIPVCIPPGFDDDTILATGPFVAVWRVLRALRTMDVRLADELDTLTRTPSRRGILTGDRVLERVIFKVPSMNDLNWLQARVVDFLSPQWDLTFNELEAFAARQGHARPPSNTRLGQWCERQRCAQRRGMLPTERAQRLRELPGWAWDLAEQRWLDQWTQVDALANERRGGLDIHDADIAETKLTTPELRTRISTVGRWCAKQRQLIRNGQLDQWRIDKLHEIDGWIDEPLKAQDAQAVMLLAEYIAWKGTANAPANVVEDDVALGRWLNDVRRRRATNRLPQPLVDEIMLISPSEGDGKLRWYREETLWLMALEALHQFASREGHCRIPSEHKEQLTDVAIPLWAWCRNQRHLYRTGRLIPARAHILDKVPGWQWEHQPAPRVLMDIGDTPHGERTGYAKGCRCAPCTEANNADNRAREARVAAGLPSSDQVDATSARNHLRHLERQGAAKRALARASGLNLKTIRKLVAGETLRVLPETERAVLALTMADVRAATGAGSSVDAGPTWELLNDMMARGWPKAWIARELGTSSLQLRKDSVTAANAAKVAALAARLGGRHAPKRPGRTAIPPLEELVASDEFWGRDQPDPEVEQWARPLLRQGYQVPRVAARTGLSIESVTALTGRQPSAERTAS